MQSLPHKLWQKNAVYLLLKNVMTASYNICVLINIKNLHNLIKILVYFIS